MSFLELLPYKPSLAEEIARGLLSSKNVVLIRAPAGSGKTSIAVAYIIHLALLGKRGAIFLRTRREVNHALSITRAVVSRLKTAKLLVIPTPSKERFCVMGIKKELIKYWCPITECERLLRRKYGEIEKDLMGKVFSSLDSYIELFARDKRCPYYAALELLRKADIIIGTHNYFIESELFEKLGKIDVAVIDEAHALLVPKTYEGSIEAIERGKEYARAAAEQGIPLHKYIVALGKTDTNSARDLAEYDSYIKADGIEIKLKGKLIKVYLPKDLIRDRLQNVNRIILMSSTLYPSNFFKTIFTGNAIDADMIIIPGLISGRRKLIIPRTNLSLSYAKRNEKTLLAYAEMIKNIQTEHREKTLVFCPSNEIAREIAKYLKKEPTDELGEDLVITVFRGKIAEGIDATGYKVAIMAGLPFPRIDPETEKILQTYSKIYKIDEKAIKEAYNLSSMISALVQAIGRVGRREEGIVYIIDARAELIRTLLQSPS
ncbi:MAG: hypothetical protein NDP13_04175 [Crenarchaeota archaeon]|nr:hypothetical protein [Thermoproteota archaeon]MCR8455817.1 hypothetical protein [Thermoproteota archaeon]MCR8501693.1 hypothetical protein [Thermoproteota archaeon]